MIEPIPTEDNNEAEDEHIEFVYESVPPAEYIQAAYFSLAAVDNIDVELVTREEAKRIRKIKKMAIELIYESISSLHSDFFEEEESDD